MTRPPALAGYAEKTEVSSNFIGWPVSVGLDAFRRRHGCLCEFKCLFDLWPFSDVLLPLPPTNLAFNPVGVLATPQDVWIFRHSPHQLCQRLFVLAVVLRIDMHGLNIHSALFLRLEPVDAGFD
jgi:hypothetical protein